MVGRSVMRLRKRRDIEWYLLFLGTFFLHQLLQWRGIHFRFLDGYLDPLLAVPIMMGTSLLIIRIWRSQERFFISTIVLFTAAISLIFEGPWQNHPKLYTDIWDIPFYALGALLFAKTINKIPTPAQ